ncbi:hypothetical protein CC86DRAFT_136970 [Ophiobolus disseminans]|uniref:Membrane-associated proteins in eicosanoid and glutathione metabolism n=1 Tax=Ophiobolus disseminans TaxID=1469910 RepID=A0A6A7ADM5_9PLEO|nr:hypothetical protein CC86DRAFT_136970 [Ophiobolus disseminans]
MAPPGVALGLRAGPSATLIPNYAPAFLAFHFIWAYGVLSSRTLKQWYGIDHNESPRHDLDKYGNQAVKSGKITQKQLDILRRNESAHANAVENYAFFVGAIGFATLAGVDRRLINSAGLAYTLARVAYGFIYILVEDRLWSQLRGVTWWISNSRCLYLLWQAGNKLNGTIQLQARGRSR